MKITDPYSPTARAKASVKPVRTAGTRGGNNAVQNRARAGGPERGRHRARAGGPERGRRFLELTIDLGNERLHGPNCKRQADKDQRDKDALRRKGDLPPER